MVSQRLLSTRNQLKRKTLELQTNAPVKKARVLKMKELAEMFQNEKNNNDDNNSHTNTKNYFTSFYSRNKAIYPWLTKEVLRWHVRALDSRQKENKKSTDTEECDNKTANLESVFTDHDDEVRSHDR